MINDDDSSMYSPELPCWRFSLWDIPGIALHTGAHILNALSSGAALLAQECAASANRSRQNYDLREAQRLNQAAQAEIGADLRALIEGPE